MSIVYCHKNKINGKCYIGITSKEKVEQRWKKNGQGYESSKNATYFYKAICKYGWDNFEHVILKDGISFEEAKQLEKHFIKLYNCKVPNGYNMTDGGEGCCGKVLSMETRKLISLHHADMKGKNNPNYGNHKMAGKNNPMYGKHLKGILSPNYGKKASVYTKNLISLHHADVSGTNNPRCRKVAQIDISTGKVIKIFDCIKYAANELHIATGSNISACARGKIKAAYGYRWAYIS